MAKKVEGAVIDIVWLSTALIYWFSYESVTPVLE